ncbi:hypothetical protein PVK06_039667 [Gossypium arboreum]|uniref:Uncharacterized protein n=1 Tax=Gossypium arboreum TaxID=29729 RepID=A0ABR0N449_GOSAR|nr:hypothetical protein PVK06_039667 [Gossypium arboreum]
MDGPIVTGSSVVPSKMDLYKAMLRKVPNMFDDGRISINWLEDNFEKLLEDPTEKWQLPILRPRVADPYVFQLVTRLNHGPSYAGLPEELEDFRLLLNQCSKAEGTKVPLIVYATVEMHDLGVTVVQVEAMNSTATARHE